MTKLININLLIFLAAGCGQDSEHNYESGRIYGQLTDEKVLLVPGPLVQCTEQLDWNATNFIDKTLLPFYKHDVYPQIAAYAWPALGAQSSGRTSLKTPDLTTDEHKMCETIGNSIVWPAGSAEYNIRQYFDDAQIDQLIKSDHSFHPLKEGAAILTNKSYRSAQSPSGTPLFTSISLFMKVDCENAWQVRSEPLFPGYALFEIPEGKCFLSLDDQELELSSGQKVLITLRGYYKNDPNMPMTRTEVKITSLSFRYLK